MLGKKLVDSQSPGSTLQRIKRRVALSKCDGVPKVIEDGQQFAESPDAGLVERFARTATLAPEPFQRSRIWTILSVPLAPACVLDLEKVATLGAAEVRLRFRAGDAGPASETA